MTILTPWPEHKNPNPQRTASAPYNFVPLPEKIISAVGDANELPSHDEYVRGSYSGYFDVTLTTRAPLYIRGPLSMTEFPRHEEPEIKNKPEFFHTGNERNPVIPGSSIRGMLRSLLEIVSYSKIQWVSDKQLFFRTVDNTAVGKYYNSRMVEELGMVQEAGSPCAPGYRARVEGGFFHIHQDGTYSIEKCAIARVERQDLLRLFGLQYNRELYQLEGQKLNQQTERNPNQTPNWLYQHREIWADIDSVEKNYFFPKKITRGPHPDFYLRFRRARNLAKTSVQGKQSGKLVLTGNMVNKHLAFLFIPLERPEHIKVPNDPQEENINKRLVDCFHDEDQLTQWQKKAFPVDRLPGVPPQPDGHLRDGDPVFFLLDTNEKPAFFGRAQMFRLPYRRSPFDLVPEALRNAGQIDYAEALFGFVRARKQLRDELGPEPPKQGEKGRAYAGRVIVTDAVLQSDSKDIWLAGDFDQPPITPKILASPKPTAFQHYLTQQQPHNQRALDHYDSRLPEGDPTTGDDLATTIRGHKLYWHQGLGTDLDAGLKLYIEQIRARISKKFDQVEKEQEDKQHTRMKPLKPGVIFSFRVSFENLSARELGALCWTLHPRGEPEQRYCHHLGMGKPLGMGAVELHARLHLINRPQRYSTLFNGDSWQLGEALTSEDLALPNVLEHWTKPFEEHLLYELNPSPPCENLRDMQRIALLLKLLAWPGYRPVEAENRYLSAEKRPNTRYMLIQRGNEYRERFVLPDPTAFDPLYFNDKARPQDHARETGPAPPAKPVVAATSAKYPDMQKVEAAIRELERMKEHEVAGQIQHYYRQWQQLKSTEAREKLARVIVAKVRQAKREKTCSKQSWYQELLVSLPEERGEQATSD